MEKSQMLEQVELYVHAVMRAGNLNEYQAKTLVYYAVMTWSDDPRIRPIIDLNGESGTGKNGIMRQIKPWCRDPKWINARNITPAGLRDELAEKVTAFVEEADKTTRPSESENWYQLRYEETGKEINYRRQMINRRGHSVYSPETHNHFGYTILHTQTPFQSTEMDRRILRITIVKDSTRQYEITEGLDGAILVEIGLGVDWNKEIEEAQSNSAWDVWLPLMCVADYLGDIDFLEYARKQTEMKTEEDDLSKVYEPKGVVLSEITPLYKYYLERGKGHVAITSVRENTKERGYQFNERQIVKLAKDLGFSIVYPHNKAHIKVISEAELREIFENAGVSENFDEDDGELTAMVVDSSLL